MVRGLSGKLFYQSARVCCMFKNCFLSNLMEVYYMQLAFVCFLDYIDIGM
jgi:hypothetical protein